MEHRQSTRLPANAQLHLYKRGKLIGRGRVREVNRNGLFVTTECTRLSPNQILEIELSPDDQSPETFRRGKAVVVHSTAQGLGLMLEEGPQQSGIRELYSWLLRRLRNSQARKSRRSSSEGAVPRRIANY